MGDAQTSQNIAQLFQEAAFTPELVLSRIQSGRLRVQDFTPLGDSIELELGRAYLQERGSQAFIVDSESVPYVVNNDGNISDNAARLLFANLEAAEQAGKLRASCN